MEYLKKVAKFGHQRLIKKARRNKIVGHWETKKLGGGRGRPTPVSVGLVGWNRRGVDQGKKRELVNLEKKEKTKKKKKRKKRI